MTWDYNDGHGDYFARADGRSPGSATVRCARGGCGVDANPLGGPYCSNRCEVLATPARMAAAHDMASPRPPVSVASVSWGAQRRRDDADWGVDLADDPALSRALATHDREQRAEWLTGHVREEEPFDGQAYLRSLRDRAARERPLTRQRAAARPSLARPSARPAPIARSTPPEPTHRHPVSGAAGTIVRRLPDGGVICTAA